MYQRLLPPTRREGVVADVAHYTGDTDTPAWTQGVTRQFASLRGDLLATVQPGETGY